MKRLLAWAGAGDWMNAVAIKEFRQAVQSRWVIAVLMLFLLINVFVVGGYLALNPDAATSTRGGRDTFTGLLVILMLTSLAFVPLYSGIRLSLERNDANIDLLFITTIRPGAIVRGKYLSAMGLTLLIFSTCMPFMVLTYLLGGVDLPTIFFVLAAGYTACAVANAIGMFAGSVSGSWLIRGLIAALGLFSLFYGGGLTLAFLIGEVLERGMGTALGTDIWQFWGMLGTLVLLALLAIGLFYVLSVAMLSPVLSNRMFVPRLYLVLCCFSSGCVAGVWSWCEHDVRPVVVWMVGSGIVWIITAVASMGERDTWTARVRRKIPRNRLLRPVAFVLYTGSAGGVIFSALMFAATIGAAYYFNYVSDLHAYSSFSRISFHDEAANMAIIFGYVLCYCLTTAFLRVTVLRRLPTATLSLITAIVASFFLIVPYFIGLMVLRNTWHDPPWYMFSSPLVLTTERSYASVSAYPVVIVWLLIGVLASSPWILGQMRRFLPLEAK